MDYVNVVFHAPLWHVSDITVTFACLANSNYGCSLSFGGARLLAHTKKHNRGQLHKGRLTVYSKHLLQRSILIAYVIINILKKLHFRLQNKVNFCCLYVIQLIRFVSRGVAGMQNTGRAASERKEIREFLDSIHAGSSRNSHITSHASSAAEWNCVCLSECVSMCECCINVHACFPQSRSNLSKWIVFCPSVTTSWKDRICWRGEGWQEHSMQRVQHKQLECMFELACSLLL